MATDSNRPGISALDSMTPCCASVPDGLSPYPVPRHSPRRANYRDMCMTYEGSQECLQVRAPDLSANGLFINTDRYFPQGAVLNLSFRLAQSGWEVRARGEVRYCIAEVGIGVEFVEISEPDRRAIEAEAQ